MKYVNLDFSDCIYRTLSKLFPAHCAATPPASITASNRDLDNAAARLHLTSFPPPCKVGSACHHDIEV